MSSIQWGCRPIYTTRRVCRAINLNNMAVCCTKKPTREVLSYDKTTEMIGFDTVMYQIVVCLLLRVLLYYKQCLSCDKPTQWNGL